jgi:hypothetical protein
MNERFKKLVAGFATLVVAVTLIGLAFNVTAPAADATSALGRTQTVSMWTNGFIAGGSDALLRINNPTTAQLIANAFPVEGNRLVVQITAQCAAATGTNGQVQAFFRGTLDGVYFPTNEIISVPLFLVNSTNYQTWVGTITNSIQPGTALPYSHMAFCGAQCNNTNRVDLTIKRRWYQD